jgi:hypothetical protein
MRDAGDAALEHGSLVFGVWLLVPTGLLGAIRSLR